LGEREFEKRTKGERKVPSTENDDGGGEKTRKSTEKGKKQKKKKAKRGEIQASIASYSFDE